MLLLRHVGGETKTEGYQLETVEVTLHVVPWLLCVLVAVIVGPSVTSCCTPPEAVFRGGG